MTEDKLFNAVHEYSDRIRNRSTSVHGAALSKEEARAELLEAIREWALASECGTGWSYIRDNDLDELRAKAAVCDAYVESDPNNTTGVQEIYDAREKLRELQESNP